MSGKTILILCLAIGLLVIGIVGAVIYSYWSDWSHPWGTADQEFLIDIEKGMTAEQIANLLKDKGVLKDTTFFLIMADLQGFGGSLKAGEYRISGASSPVEIVEMMGRGDIHRRRFVLPEGITINQVAQILEETQICKAADFLQAAGFGQVYQDAGLKSGGRVTAPGAEGFLFPDTYFMEKNCEPPSRVRDRLMRRFNEVYNYLLEQVPEAERWWMLEENGSVPAMVTLASLVEREAKRDEDRPLVASVFRNRIKQGMPLQSDATIHYIIGDWSRPITPEEKQIDDPYNTFLNKGLPPGPICNPGRASLVAAMAPAKTDYLYFMATGDGKTEFSKTLDEHNAMRQRVRTDQSQPGQ
ncbi:MAG TPA: endolytic transglycosylase MltG [bacterium]|nr:endolytic transglycosylase MltG [bacterium]